GYVITNHHVIEDSSIIEVILNNGQRYRATVYRDAPTRDIAILKINANNLPVPVFKESTRVRLGDIAVTVGYGLTNIIDGVTVGVGVVSRIGIYSPDNLRYIQSDATINHGNSGGVLVDMNGAVIGITQSFQVTWHGEGVNNYYYSVPIEDALGYLP
ncbi:MAG: trypsin-like peptidase domain-containing protein, partial [Dehalococcoidales bacterium]|nr:trypsin-like peptidase domain-containing protein [Dehalococcoidales bacterium]